MVDRLQSFLEAMQVAFVEGRIQDLMVYCMLPLVVYTPVGVTLIRDRSQFREMVELYREAMFALNVVSTEIVIEQLDHPYNHRFRALARSTDFNAEGKPVTGSLIRYFLAEHEDGFKVEMMEYLELPLPIPDVERIVH